MPRSSTHQFSPIIFTRHHHHPCLVTSSINSFNRLQALKLYLSGFSAGNRNPALVFLAGRYLIEDNCSRGRMSHTSKNDSQNHTELIHQESHCEFKDTPLRLQSRNQEAAGEKLLPPHSQSPLPLGKQEAGPDTRTLLQKNLLLPQTCGPAETAKREQKNQKPNPQNPHDNNQIINSAYYVASTLLLLSLFYEWENRSTERAAPHFRLPNLAGVNLISGACSTYKHCKGGKCSC